MTVPAQTVATGTVKLPVYPPYEAIWFSLCYERMLAA
jgi:hypothetical protein